MATAKPIMQMKNGATKAAAKSRSSIFSTPGIHLRVDKPIGHDFLYNRFGEISSIKLSARPACVSVLAYELDYGNGRKAGGAGGVMINNKNVANMYLEWVMRI